MSSCGKSKVAALVFAVVAGGTSMANGQPETIDPPDADLDEGTPEGEDAEPSESVEDDVEDTGEEVDAEPPEVQWEGVDETEEDAPEPVETEGEEPSDERAERRRISAQTALEEAEPRPPLPEAEEPEAPPWKRRLEIGASFAFVLRPLADGVVESDVAYNPAPGFGIHLHWNIVDWFRFSPYFVDAHHGLDIPPGSLVSGTPKSISPNAQIDIATVTTFVFGAKLQPTWNITDRLRTWATAGVGWGKLDFPTMTITEGDRQFMVFGRDSVFVEFPLGLGISFDVIERWVALEYEATAAPITGQAGNAHRVFQTVDADGQIRDVGPFGAFELSVVQTLGASLVF